MLTEDYLIRMINLAIAALLRIIGLKKDGGYGEALLLIDITLEQLLGLRATMIKNLDDDRLYYLLTRGNQLDTQRLLIISDLFKEEGDIYAAQNRLQESREDYIRALRYAIEVFFNEPLEVRIELTPKIEYLIQQLDFPTLGSDTLWPLSGYYEETGAYAKAEAVFLIMVQRPDIRAQIRPELTAFYERMLQKPAEALAQGGLDAVKVHESWEHSKEE